MYQGNPQADFGLENGHCHLHLSDSTDAGKGVAKTIKTGEARRRPLHPSYCARVIQSTCHV